MISVASYLMWNISSVLFLVLANWNVDSPFQNVTHLQKVEIQTSVWLEGALSPHGDRMHTKLYKKGYLPGQQPKTFFGQATHPGQPYMKSPWKHQGQEGFDIQKNRFRYPDGTVDWILVSLHANNESFTPVYTTSALLMKDGSVRFTDDSPPCQLDTRKSYFIVIEHRNHLGIISHLPIDVVDGKISYDFRKLGQYSARLSGQKAVSANLFAMMAGNGDQSSTSLTYFSIDERDLDLWRNQNGQNSAYYSMDLDLSGDVNIKDQELLLSNYGITTAVPLASR